MSLPFILSSDFITVVSNNKPHTIYSNDGRFNKLKEALKTKNWAIIPEIISLPKAIALFSAGKVQVFEGEVAYNGKPIHNSLTTRILEFAREGFPFESLVKFMDNLMENPCQKSIEMVFEYLERYKMPIGDDGAVYGMKAIRANYTDKWTGTINNRPGQYNKMPREQISCDPNCAVGPGFHHGFEDFVRGYGSGDDRVVLTKFFPKNICRIPVDACWQKIVVCEYEVIADLGTVETFGNFSSNYAPDSNVTRDVIKPHEQIATEVANNQGEIKYIGADKAYKLYREGCDVISGIYGIVYANSNKKYSRAFFRKYNDWQLA